ncbi:MAG: hypothetical protein ACLP9L_24745 [Thermoguttaceae bacterium]
MYGKKFALLLMLALGTSPAWSDSLPVGGTVTPPLESLPTLSGPVDAQTSSSLLVFGVGPSYGTLYSEVVGTPGNYDFLYQFQSNGTDPDGFNSLVIHSFTGVTTDVGWSSSPISGFALGNAGAFAPSQVNRPTADLINWDFSPAVTGWSDVLLVATNAASYTTVSNYTTDTDPAYGSAYVPFGGALVPEPSCVMGLFGLLSMAGLGLVWKWKR